MFAGSHDLWVCAAVVRVADLQYSLVARALDSGAQGIIFPRMEDPKLLETALSWTKFPPTGVRGYGLTACQTDYESRSFSDVIEHVNENTLTVLQIESKRAVEAREEILSVPGIDAVMIGPSDLSISLGVPGEFQHPKVIEAMEAIRDTCDRHGIAPGTQTRSVPQAKFWRGSRDEVSRLRQRDWISVLKRPKKRQTRSGRVNCSQNRVICLL